MAVSILEGENIPKELSAGVIFKALRYAWDDEVDVYFGKQCDLIAAGLAQVDQFVRSGSTWRNGERVIKRCRKDETYRRIFFRKDMNLWRVDVGLTSAEARMRKVAVETARNAARAAEVARENQTYEERLWASAEEGMQKEPSVYLKGMPKTTMDFRLALIQDLRSHLHFHIDRATRASARHGFILSADAAEGIALAFDAVSEALLSADVICDARRQADIVHRLQTYIVQGGGGAPRQVAEVIKVNPALLLGEAS